MAICHFQSLTYVTAPSMNLSICSTPFTYITTVITNRATWWPPLTLPLAPIQLDAHAHSPRVVAERDEADLPGDNRGVYLAQLSDVGVLVTLEDLQYKVPFGTLGHIK